MDSRRQHGGEDVEKTSLLGDNAMKSVLRLPLTALRSGQNEMNRGSCCGRLLFVLSPLASSFKSDKDAKSIYSLLSHFQSATAQLEFHSISITFAVVVVVAVVIVLWLLFLLFTLTWKLCSHSAPQRNFPWWGVCLKRPVFFLHFYS